MAANVQALTAEQFQPNFWRRYVLPPDPSQPSRVWHTSPAIDMAAYHFSWIWLLIPFLLINWDGLPFYVYAVMMGANLAHRHYGLPYAYLDDGVFRQYKRQLTWFPLLCLAMFAATPLMLIHEERRSLLSQALMGVVAFSVLWNIWHTYMQKFGILRLYLAKEPAAASKTPGWVDKYFLLCWIPLYFAYAVPKNKDQLLDYGTDLYDVLSAITTFMEKYETILLIPSILIAAGGIGLWLYHEWRSQRFRNHARLSAAIGTTLISTALFWMNPMNAIIAFAFSHAVEYMVFVWAFQRRFYNQPRQSPPVMQRLLSYPRSWYALFTGVFVVAGFFQVLWGYKFFVDADPVSFFGLTGARWYFYYAVFESLVHFHMDGFLWKMRRPEVSSFV